MSNIETLKQAVTKASEEFAAAKTKLESAERAYSQAVQTQSGANYFSAGNRANVGAQVKTDC